jgi:serine acetyltransferase
VVRADIHADILRYLHRSPQDSQRGEGVLRRVSAFLTPQLMALALYRVSHYLYMRGWHLLGHGLASLNYVVHKVRLPAASCIGPGCRLAHPAGVVFEGSAGRELTLFSYAVCVADPLSVARRAPRLGNRVTVGGHAVLCGAIEVGDDVRISQCAVVRRDVASDLIVASQAMYTSSHIRSAPVEDGR